MNEEEKKVIKMLDKFTTEHKLYNIKQSDGLEDNIEIVLNLIEKLQKENSIKEDIKILEKKIEDYKPYKNIEYCSHAGQILQEEHKALEHILSDYKRVLQENEKYKEFFDLMLRLDSDYFMNCGDEETIKLVDEILKLESE